MWNGSQRWPDGAVKEGKLIWTGRRRGARRRPGAPLEPGQDRRQVPVRVDQVDAVGTGAQGAGQAAGRVQVR
jgi:hypothetical protein